MYLFNSCLNAVLIVMVLTCTVSDLLYGKIWNRVIIPGMAAGISLRIILEGVSVVPEVMTALLFPFILLFPFWYFSKGKGIGAGDIKLLMAVGACLSINELLISELISFVAAAVYGLVKIAGRIRQQQQSTVGTEERLKTGMANRNKTVCSTAEKNEYKIMTGTEVPAGFPVCLQKEKCSVIAENSKKSGISFRLTDESEQGLNMAYFIAFGVLLHIGGLY